jgi:hypothetical protein
MDLNNTSAARYDSVRSGNSKWAYDNVTSMRRSVLLNRAPDRAKHHGTVAYN